MALRMLDTGSRAKKRCPYCEKYWDPTHYLRHEAACRRKRARARVREQLMDNPPRTPNHQGGDGP